MSPGEVAPRFPARLAVLTTILGSKMSAQRPTLEEDFEDEEGGDFHHHEDDEASNGSDSEDLPIHYPPSPKSQKTTLEDAIKTAPGHVARDVLHGICLMNPGARELASAKLLRPIGRSIMKRKAYEVCANCGCDYETGSNEAGSCVYHPGT